MFSRLILLILSVIMGGTACNTRGPLDDVEVSNERSANVTTEPASTAEIESQISRNTKLLAAFSSSIGDLSIKYGEITALHAQLIGLESPEQWKDIVSKLQETYTAREEAHAYMVQAENAAIASIQETNDAVSTLSFEDGLDAKESLQKQEEQLETVQNQREQLVNLIESEDASQEEELATPTSPSFAFDSGNDDHFQTSCEGNYLTSLEGRNGLIVDQLIPVCNNNRGTPAGGASGSISTPIVCPAGFIAKGIYVRQGDFVDGVALICASPDSFDSANENRTEVLGNTTGGTPVERYCPPYTAVTGLAGVLGLFNDSVAMKEVYPICTKRP